jgi:RimJ/RimL family protein N-acetyltransferase
MRGSGWIVPGRRRLDQGLDEALRVDRGETQVIGGTGLHLRVEPDAREVGYWIAKDCEGKGMMSEVVGALARVAFEIDRIARVEIHCDPENERSAAVPRRLGYTHEATLRQRVPTTDHRRRDSMIWSLLAEEYPNSPSSSASLEAFDAAGRRLL